MFALPTPVENAESFYAFPAFKQDAALASLLQLFIWGQSPQIAQPSVVHNMSLYPAVYWSDVVVCHGPGSSSLFDMLDNQVELRKCRKSCTK